MAVTRYYLDEQYGEPYMSEDPNGNYVGFDDYEKLRLRSLYLEGVVDQAKELVAGDTGDESWQELEDRLAELESFDKEQK